MARFLWVSRTRAASGRNNVPLDGAELRPLPVSHAVIRRRAADSWRGNRSQMGYWVGPVV
jgi:hypothetical protein